MRQKPAPCLTLKAAALLVFPMSVHAQLSLSSQHAKAKNVWEKHIIIDKNILVHGALWQPAPPGHSLGSHPGP